MNEKQKLFTRHSIGTRIAALFMLLILVITAAMTYVSISVSTNELLDSSTEYTEQLIRLLADERIRYLTSLGKRNYDHPLNRKQPDSGTPDDNSRLLAWFLLDALATIFTQYCNDKKMVLAGKFLQSGCLRNHFK